MQSTSAQDVSSSNNNSNINNVSNKKQRIVAEVKPMRMSYSDVVSKNAVPTTSTSIGQTNSASSSPNTTMPITINNNNNSKGTKVKYTPSNSFEKKQQQQQENVDKNRKSPTNPIITNNATNAEVKKNPPVVVKAEKPTIAAQNQSSSTNNSNGKKKKQQTKDSVNAKSAKNQNDATVKNQEKYATDSDNDEDENSSMLDSDNEEDNATLSSDYYDIRKNVYQGEHHKVEKIRTSAYKKNSKQAQSSTTQTSTSKKVDRGQKRMSGKATINRKPKHEFLQKLFASCVEYLYIFVKWLWMLIYDVSYLSFGIVLDRLNWTYQYCLHGVSLVRRELSTNPGKALIVRIKNVWKRFDNKFDKKSKWAFWRWLFKKQSNSDNSKDSYKDGKLPKTAEEAMKSLLNCKEKDAYR
jgi:DnaJ family protein C protein 14